MTAPTRALLDTSVFIAQETAHPLDTSRLPDEFAISVITLGELHAGVLAARDIETRTRRLATLEALASIYVLPINEEVALIWAYLRARLADVGRRLNVNDSWIAATALVHDLPIVTQDSDYSVLSDVAGFAFYKL